MIDATGRGSRAPVFLEELGYDRPREDELVINLGAHGGQIERHFGRFGAIRSAEGNRCVTPPTGCSSGSPTCGT